jgi:hypothetical protein
MSCRAQKTRIGPVTRSFFDFARPAWPPRPRWGIQPVHRARHLFREHCQAILEPMSHLRMGGMHRRIMGGPQGNPHRSFPAECSIPTPPEVARSSKLVLGFWAGPNQPRKKPAGHTADRNSRDRSTFWRVTRADETPKERARSPRAATRAASPRAHCGTSIAWACLSPVGRARRTCRRSWRT